MCVGACASTHACVRARMFVKDSTFTRLFATHARRLFVVCVLACLSLSAACFRQSIATAVLNLFEHATAC